jgi:uncharacterized membrane protein (DUF373 family)
MDHELPGNGAGNGPSGRLRQIMNKFEVVVITALELLIVLTVAVGTAKVLVIFIDSMPSQVPGIDSADALLPVLQNVFGGVLMVLLGLELLQTLKAYFREQHLQIELILVVAMIAVGRHIILADVGHTPGTKLAGLAILIASLAASYFLVKKAHIAIPPVRPAPRITDEPPNA